MIGKDWKDCEDFHFKNILQLSQKNFYIDLIAAFFDIKSPLRRNWTDDQIEWESLCKASLLNYNATIA